VTRRPGVGSHGHREASALTARPTLLWQQPAGYDMLERTGCSASHQLFCATGHPRRVRSGFIDRYTFHRSVVPGSVRG
jgi:hypothetical protein